MEENIEVKSVQDFSEIIEEKKIFNLVYYQRIRLSEVKFIINNTNEEILNFPYSLTHLITIPKKKFNIDAYNEFEEWKKYCVKTIYYTFLEMIFRGDIEVSRFIDSYTKIRGFDTGAIDGYIFKINEEIELVSLGFLETLILNSIKDLKNDFSMKVLIEDVVGYCLGDDLNSGALFRKKGTYDPFRDISIFFLLKSSLRVDWFLVEKIDNGVFSKKEYEIFFEDTSVNELSELLPLKDKLIYLLINTNDWTRTFGDYLKKMISDEIESRVFRDS